VLKKNFNLQLSRSRLKREAPVRGERTKCQPPKEQHLKPWPIPAVRDGAAEVVVAGGVLGRNQLHSPLKRLWIPLARLKNPRQRHKRRP
jgi:hypothetical protein